MKFNNLREVIRVLAFTTTQFSNSITDGDKTQIWNLMCKLHKLQKYILTAEFIELKAIDTANQNAFRYEYSMLLATIQHGKEYLQNRAIKGGKVNRFRKWG